MTELTLTELDSGSLAAGIDPDRGVLRSVRDTDGPPGLDYLGGPAPFPSDLGTEELWTGDLVLRVWDGHGWRLESTARSADIRAVSRTPDGRTQISYLGESSAPGGLRGLDVRQWLQPGPQVLRWTIEITNRTAERVEVGEVAVPLVANTDLAGIFGGLPPAERAGGEPQRRWHEDRVQQFLHVGGHGSYVLLQRPAGDGRILAVVPSGDTAVEAAYQIDPGQGNQWSNVFEGPYFLGLRTRAARAVHGWLANREKQNYYLHGHTSLVLAPGAAQTFGFELALLDDADGLPARLVEAGQIAVDAAPGYTVPLGQRITVAVSCTHPPRLTSESAKVTITPLAAPAGTGDARVHRYALDFGSTGQKAVKVSYGDGRWTRLLCYVTPPAADLLRDRAAFIAGEQLYDNPDDRFGRHHAFLPYDDQLQQVYTDSEECWQVGGSDEYGLPVAMFLAEKNARQPEPDEIAALETYIDDWLLGTLQDPATLEVRRGLYFREPELPSRDGHEWTEAESRDTQRFNNYPLVANIYHAMYRVARDHSATRAHSAAGYLTLAWRTAVLGFGRGLLVGAGAPAGAGLYSLLEDLAGADPDGYVALDAHLRAFADLAARDPYPYGSELYVDQTAHSQVYLALDRYGPEAPLDRCIRVTRAMRWGFQPSWFRYGNEQRGSVCCWYGTPQNSEILLRAYRRTGDPRLVKLATAGLASFLTSVRASGAARGWFTWWPDRTGFDSRSLDTDLGLYGYLRAAAAYVLTEPTFGLTGYMCAARPGPDGSIEVEPANGVDDTIHFCDHDLSVYATAPIRRARFHPAGRVLELEVAPSRHSGQQPAARLEGAPAELRLQVLAE